MKNMNELLISLDACTDAKKWAKDKTWQEVFDTCHRGDWLLWLFKRTNVGDLKLLTLAKGHCANTVRHLMKDERSIKAVDAAIAFGSGKITREQLNAAAAAAAATAAAAYTGAYTAAVAAYAYTAAYTAADAAAYAYAAAAYAAAAYADADADAAATADAAKVKNQLLTADIVRKYIPIELWSIK